MIKLDLTKIQIQYLLYIKSKKNNKTITSTSICFNCSKTNSKKILDRMVTLGVLYKDGHEYNPTKIGDKLANCYDKKRKNIILVLQKIFKIEKNIAEELSFEIMGRGMEEFYSSIDERAEKIEQIEKLSAKVEKEKLIELLGRGKHKINFCIYKNHEDKADSFIEKSMAYMGFEEDAHLIIDDNPYISLKSKIIEKPKEGYKKKGIATKVFYYKDNKKYEINSNEREFKIPLDIIDYWNNTGEAILQAGLMLIIKSQIGMNLHIKEANFLFSVNLGLI